MSQMLRVLILEDRPSDARLVVSELRQAGYDPQWERVDTEQDYLARLESTPDIILADYNLPQFSAPEALKILRNSGLDIPFIIVSGSIGEEVAVVAMKEGATDFLLKDRMGRLGQAVGQAMEQRRLRDTQRQAEETLQERTQVILLSAEVGLALNRSGPMSEMLQHCAQSLVNNLDAAFARIWTLNDAENILELQASAGIYTHLDGAHRRVPVGKLKIGLIAQERMPHLTNDVLNDPRVSDLEWARREGMVAFAGYPLLLENRLVGVMALFARHPLTPAVLDAMAAVANQIATGIDRKRTEEHLRFTQFTIDHISTAVFWFDPNGRFFLVNDSACQLTGYTREELLARQIFDLDPNLTAASWSQIWKDLHERGALTAESCLRLKDGKEIPIRVNSNLLRVAGRECSCTLLEDITEQKRAEQRLAAQHQVTRILSECGSLAEAAPRILEAICESQGWDIGGIACVNADQSVLRFVDMWKRPELHAEEFETISKRGEFSPGRGLPGRVWAQDDALWCPDVSQETDDLRSTAASAARFHSFLGFPIRSPQGVLGVLEFFSREMREPDPELTDMFKAIGSQIGQFMVRKRAEEAIRESEVRFRTVFNRLQLQIERMPLAYLLFDADLRLTDWNPAAERIFGYRKDEVLGMKPPFQKIAPPAFWDRGEEILQRVREGDMSAQSVNANLTKDGRTITCEWMNTPLVSESGEFDGLMSLAYDITERIQLEEQFRQAQKMEAVGQLAGGVAHDFNNLLTVITGYSEMLLEILPPADPNRELLQEINKAGQRSAALTQQLLAFSRKQVLAPKVLDLNEVVKNTEKMLRRVIGEDVKLATILPDVARVKADPGQLEQVLLNLSVNARDAMPQGGDLTIETRNVELDNDYVEANAGVRAGRYVLLCVTDSGHGISPEVQRRLFEPFFTTKETGKGTGLGLAVVHGIVKQSDGHIKVYSELGSGTSFKIYLPAIEQPALERQAAADRPAVPGGTETILLVEDEDSVRALGHRALVRYGYEVLVASNPTEAVRISQTHTGPIELLLTDVVMPQMNGRRLAEILSLERPAMQVLYMSGYTDDAVVRQGVLSAGVNFLHKPFSPAALAAKVRSVLDAGTPKEAILTASPAIGATHE